jgi:hypothetical protein
LNTNLKESKMLFRAIVAWVIFNAILLATLGATGWLLGGNLSNGFVQVPLAIAIIVTEWVISVETIVPVIRDWIRGN